MVGTDKDRTQDFRDSDGDTDGMVAVVETAVEEKPHILIAIMDNAQTHITPITNFEGGGIHEALHNLVVDHHANILHYKVFRKEAYRVWDVVEEWDVHVPALIRMVTQIRSYDPANGITADDMMTSLKTQADRLKTRIVGGTATETDDEAVREANEDLLRDKTPVVEIPQGSPM